MKTNGLLSFLKRLVASSGNASETRITVGAPKKALPGLKLFWVRRIHQHDIDDQYTQIEGQHYRVDVVCTVCGKTLKSYEEDVD